MIKHLHIIGMMKESILNILIKVIKMYLGYVQEFIDKEMRNKNEFKNNAELISKYLEILWYANHPLYPYQFKQMAKVVSKIEELISDTIFNDLKDLSDKDLILKYELPAHKISMRYHNIDVENIKESAKTDLLYKRDMFWNDYKLNVAKWGVEYE